MVLSMAQVWLLKALICSSRSRLNSHLQLQRLPLSRGLQVLYQHCHPVVKHWFDRCFLQARRFQLELLLFLGWRTFSEMVSAWPCQIIPL